MVESAISLSVTDRLMEVEEYSPRKFYYTLMRFDDERIQKISRAMDAGTEEDVQEALIDYFASENFGGPELFEYIRSENWIEK